MLLLGDYVICTFNGGVRFNTNLPRIFSILRRLFKHMLLKAQSITKSFGTLKVLTDVSLQINENDSIGLIGANGSGKSTFLKIILGELKSDTGDLIRNTKRIGYLNQFAESS